MKKVWQYAILFSILCILISFLYPLYGALDPIMNDYATVYRESKMIWVTLVGCAWLVVSVIKLQSQSDEDGKDKKKKK